MPDGTLRAFIAPPQSRIFTAPPTLTPAQQHEALMQAQAEAEINRRMAPSDVTGRLIDALKGATVGAPSYQYGGNFPGGQTYAGGLAELLMAAAPLVGGAKALSTAKTLGEATGMTDEAIRIANATSRARGAIGAKAVVPRAVESIATPEMKILDFGAGKDAAHAQRLRANGLNVSAYDFGSNVIPGLHDPDALSKSHDLVYASNVLNTQSSPEMLKTTTGQIFQATKPGGQIVVNLPASPRKFEGLTPELVKSTLESTGFTNVQRIGGTAREPIYSAIKP